MNPSAPTQEDTALQANFKEQFITRSVVFLWTPTKLEDGTWACWIRVEEVVDGFMEYYLGHHPTITYRRIPKNSS
jgi:hypothetical protein